MNAPERTMVSNAARATDTAALATAGACAVSRALAGCVSPGSSASPDIRGLRNPFSAAPHVRYIPSNISSNDGPVIAGRHWITELPTNQHGLWKFPHHEPLSMPQNPLLLTHRSLYELVWSKPMSSLAGDFGISDVALAKRCRQVDVPIPYRGYWARIAAGQKPDKIPLPKYRSQTAPATNTATTTPPKQAKALLRDGPEPTVHFGLPTEPPEGDSTPRIDIATLRNRLDALNLTPINCPFIPCPIGTGRYYAAALPRPSLETSGDTKSKH